MNRHCKGHRKLVHVDVVQCAEMSNTADGTKCLREPLSTYTKDSKSSHGLIPRPSRKHIKSCNQSFQMSGISSFNRDYVGVDPSETDRNRQQEWTQMGFSDKHGDGHSDSVTEIAEPKCSVKFVSAREYMNPTFNLLDDPVPQNDNVAAVTSIRPTHSTAPVSKVSRKPNSKHVTIQKNSLDRYFKPVPSSKPDAAQAVLETHSYTSSAEHIASCSLTPENSPRKSVLLSPIKKLPGSDTIYYSPQLSQSSTSRGSITSSQGSSSAGNMSKSHKVSAPASASHNDDDDDLDFEASFDYIWKTNPQTKRKSAKQMGQPSKKKVTQAAETSRISKQSFDSGCTQTDSVTADTSQRYDAVSPNMTAENFGLFGFSNNTLIALDSDTDFEEDAVDYFSTLPPEVVSNILCRLPFTDLCLSVNRVCVSWKNIIDDDSVSYVMIYWHSLYLLSVLLFI